MGIIKTTLASTTLSSAGETTSSIIDCDDDTITTGTTISSVAATAIGAADNVDIQIVYNAYAYVESLSNEELALLEEGLSAKELEFEIPEEFAEKNENIKTYIKE